MLNNKITAPLKFCILIFSILCILISNTNASEKIKILSFNTWHVDDTDEGIKTIANIVKASKADIIGFQELTDATKIAKELNYHLLNEGHNRQLISKFPIVQTSPNKLGIKIKLPSNNNLWIFNVHLPAYPYQPYDLRDNKIPNNETDVIAAANNARGGQVAELLKDIEESKISPDTPVFITGDFNEPSHLDWTKAAADSTTRNYDMKIQWPASTRITKAGFTDSLRKIKPDEAKHHAYTWTPRPAENEVHDRIDIVYFSGKNIKPISVKSIGPDKKSPYTDIEYIDYPSDHRAVLATFKIKYKKPKK